MRGYAGNTCNVIFAHPSMPLYISSKVGVPMKISKRVFYLIVLAYLLSCNQSEEFSQWRGPNRDGKYPSRSLLKQWPENGPELVWTFEELGKGHSSVGIGNNKLYVNGMIDTIGVLFAFDLKGNLLWKHEYGPEWHFNYQGSRSTPTVVGDLVYFESGHGTVYCYNGNTGKLIWSVDLLVEFDAKNIRWGMAESLLVDGNIIYCIPGGVKNNIVALDRFNGETIWTSPGNGQPSAYCSPILVRHNNARLVVAMTAESIIGLDAKTGTFYWSIEQHQTYGIHANTPLYHQGTILCSSESARSGPDGTLLIQLSEDGTKAEVVWRNGEIENLMGGNILLNGYVYGSIYNRSDWYCLDWYTGNVQYISGALTSGVIIYAEGLFYCYTHRGEMALVDADEKEFKVICSFRVPLGTDQHWSHPVIDDGRLYIRHGNALMVYDIAKK